MKVIVYVRVADERMLVASKLDPAEWVRAEVEKSLDRLRAKGAAE